MADNLLDIKQAAARLRVSGKTVYRMTYAGLLTPHHVGLGTKRPRVRISEAELNDFIARSAA